MSRVFFIFFAIAAVRDPRVLDIYGTLKTNIMIGEIFMHLRDCLFNHNHSLHHISSVFVMFLLFSYKIFFPGNQSASVFFTHNL